MRKRAFILLLIFMGVIITNGFTIAREVLILSHTTLHGLEKIEVNSEPAQLWIEVHDVSPGYGLEKLNEITEIIDQHKDIPKKTVLFIIPNHGGDAPIENYPDFVKELKRLSDTGYILGIHGYSHEGGIKNPEFKTDVQTGMSLLNTSRKEFERAGLKTHSYFAPPGWRSSYSFSKRLRREFDFTYYAFFIDTPTGTMPYPTHEYTWYDLNGGGLKAAKKDYRGSKGVFRLTIHVNAVNTKENLEFLDQFLSWMSQEQTAS